MNTSLAGSSQLWAVVLACISTLSGTGVEQQSPAQNGYVISGRVADPHGLRPEGAVLMLGVQRDGGFSSVPVPVRADGSFTTPRLNPATYMLQAVRTPHSRTAPAVVVGLSVVPVSVADVSGVTVTVRPDTAVSGKFRMESDNPGARWPPHIAVSAFLVFDGTPLLNGTTAEGAPGGRFVLRNAFGPRVVRTGFTLNGSVWWESRVLLDGVDITNVPTDFSTTENSQLEVVFTQHPAVLAGAVTDRQGQPVAGAWVLVFAADRTLWQPWAKTSQAVWADVKGAFRFVSLPGRYLVRALPTDAFSTQPPMLRQFERFVSGASTVDLGDRETKTLRLTLDQP